MAYSGILWHTLAYSGILLHTLAYSGILWHTLAYSGILWHTLAYSGIQCIISASLMTADGAYHCSRGNNVDLVLCVLLGHQNSKFANSMKLVNFALFSSQYHVFELKNIRGNLIAPNSNRWSLSNKIAMSQEGNRKIISLFGQEKSIFLHP